MREYYKNGDLYPVPGSAELIKTIFENGIKCALATSSLAENAENVLSRLNLGRYFQILVSSNMVKNSKPSPDIFFLCLEKLNINKNECIIIEDSKSGCLAAKAAGIKVIGLQNPSSGKQILSDSTMIVSDMREISISLLEKILDY